MTSHFNIHLYFRLTLKKNRKQAKININTLTTQYIYI